jgi:hypothetical protein
MTSMSSARRFAACCVWPREQNERRQALVLPGDPVVAQTAGAGSTASFSVGFCDVRARPLMRGPVGPAKPS